MTMNPEAASSDRLHLFQELSTLGQQFAHPLLLGSGLGKIKPMFPARPPRPRQPFGGARSSTGAAVHTASCACHRVRVVPSIEWLTCLKTAFLTHLPAILSI